MGLDVLGNEETYLLGKGAINLINNGDDEMIYTPNKPLLDKFKQLRSVRNLGHYKVDAEDGVGFSGMLMRKDPVLPLIYHPTRRLHTAFEKIYCPERSIGGLMRPYWHIGVIERINSRDLHPMGGVAWEIHDRLYYDLLAPSFGSLSSILINAEQSAPVHFQALSYQDKEVLEDNDKIHYKYRDGVISDKVANEIVAKIQPEHFLHLTNRFYKGHVL
jgi:hypothetical protein